jgi:hypothetical protein
MPTTARWFAMPKLAESQRAAINESVHPYASACCSAIRYLCWSYSPDEYPDEVDVDCRACGHVAVHTHDPDAPTPATRSTEVQRHD